MAYAAKNVIPGVVAKPVWAALRRAEGPMSVSDLHRATNAPPNAIQLRVRRWVRSGLVRTIEPAGIHFAIAPAHADRVGPPGPGSLSKAVWRALRRIDGPATFAELVAAAGAGSDRGVYCRLFRWQRSGFVVKTREVTKRFELTAEAAALVEPPKIGAALIPAPAKSARQRIWTAMRILKTFDVPMLVMTAEASRRACEDAIWLLCRADYVRLEKHSGTWATYRLVKSTGPIVPSFTNPPEGEREIVDPNLGTSAPLGPTLRRRRKAAAAKAAEARHGR